MESVHTWHNGCPWCVEYNEGFRWPIWPWSQGQGQIYLKYVLRLVIWTPLFHFAQSVFNFDIMVVYGLEIPKRFELDLWVIYLKSDHWFITWTLSFFVEVKFFRLLIFTLESKIQVLVCMIRNANFFFYNFWSNWFIFCNVLDRNYYLGVKFQDQIRLYRL